MSGIVFALTEEQVALKDSVERFCERDYGFEHRRSLLAGDEGFSRAHWATFAELGWLGAGLSEEDGGWGGGPKEVAAIQQALGRALVVEPYLSCAVIAARAVAAVAEGGRKDELLAGIVGGELLVALAHGEVEAGGDDTAVTTRAERVGDNWRITGNKAFVLGAPSADLLLVSARTPGGVSLFAVSPEAAGLQRTVYDAVDGRRVADLSLDGVEGQIVGAEGAAQAGIELAIDHGIVALMGECVGAMDAALWMTRDYLTTRRQFGTTLNTFQALQHRMADMLVETELARSMLQLGVSALSDIDPEARRARVSAAKVQISEAAIKVTAESIQLHGGIGVTEEYTVGHFYKRAVLARGLFGSTDRHLERFAAFSRGA